MTTLVSQTARPSAPRRSRSLILSLTWLKPKTRSMYWALKAAEQECSRKTSPTNPSDLIPDLRRHAKVDLAAFVLLLMANMRVFQDQMAQDRQKDLN